MRTMLDVPVREAQHRAARGTPTHAKSEAPFIAALIAALAGFGAVGAAVDADAAPQRYRIDPEHLTVAFLVDHAGFAKVLGRFLEAQGAFVFDEAAGELSDVNVVVATDSITTQHDERDDHLRGEDFLDTDRYGEMVFTADRARRIDERTYEVSGELRLLGKTGPLTLTATLNRSGDYPFAPGAHVVGVSARGSFERSDFGMTYGVADGWVGDEVEILIELEARRQ